MKPQASFVSLRWLTGLTAVVVLSVAGPSSAAAKDQTESPDDNGAPEAAAEPEGAPSSGTAPEEVPGTVTSPLDRFRQGDASADRSFLLPTAESLERGDFTINSYQLFLLGASWGLTDRVQLSFTTLLPLIQDMPLAALFNLKLQIYRDERSVLSISPSVGGFLDQDFAGTFLSQSFLYDRVLDSSGRLKLSLRSTLGVGIANGETEPGVTLSPALILVATDLVQVMAEYAYIRTIDGSGWPANPHLLTYGVRFTSPTVSVDLALVRPLDSEFGRTFPVGFPFVAFNVRF